MPKRLDLTGNKFGKLIAISKAESRGKRTFWLCECECGNKKEVPTETLIKGQSKSCGCSSHDYFKTHKSPTFKDLTGKKFGRLLVVNITKNKLDGRYNYECVCDCGNNVIANSKCLINGHTRSCGCLRIESARKKSTTHGMSKHKIYSIWTGIKDRCLNVNNKSYFNYGGRGICICNEWSNDFMLFYKWSIDNGYKENAGLSIDRIDNDKGYAPSNCRWTNSYIQSNNRRNNVKLTFNGITKNQSQWSKVLKVNHSTIQYYRRHDATCKLFINTNADAILKEAKEKGFKDAFIVAK